MLSKVIAAVSAEAQLDGQQLIDKRDEGLIQEGRTLLQSETKCTECHQFHNTDQDATGPDLTGYGSRPWLTNFITNPAHPGLYGERNDRMPLFGTNQMLTQREIGLIADWLRGHWYQPEASKAE